MLAFPVVCALTYVSANFWSVSRLHSALAFAANPRPARTIEQDMMATFTLLITISPPKQRLVPMPFRLGKVCQFLTNGAV
jgi:hypothetical protein